jgi:hypothetical protein
VDRVEVVADLVGLPNEKSRQKVIELCDLLAAEVKKGH